jgi:uncharacterized membrane protein YedE/YeeE
MRDHLGAIVPGVLLGFVLSKAGFSSWDEIHAMFTFQSLRLVLGFALSVVVLAACWRIVVHFQRPRWSARDLHPGVIPGSLLFGAGWALSGACPAIALVQIGEGKLGAVLTLVGIVAGNYAYSRLHERYFRWPASSCAEP